MRSSETRAVEDLIKELFVFHGGEAEFLARIESRVRSFLARQANEKTGAKRKLQDSDKLAWRPRYRKYSRELDDAGFRFPAELLAPYGVRSLIGKIRNLKAAHIPDLLIRAFQLKLHKRKSTNTTKLGRPGMLSPIAIPSL